MKKILIRADDLGYSRAVNYGIFDAVHNGIINNVGVMVNMPTTIQGLELVSNENIDFGMHTNISNGKPILPAENVLSLVDKNGNFKRSKVYWDHYESGKDDFVNLEEVTAEIDAQYQQFIQLVGHKPDYFEGHAVMSKNYIKGLHIIAKRYRLPMLDFSLSPETPTPFKEKTYFKVFMRSIDKNYDPFSVLKEMSEDSEQDVIPMMVCHPGYLDQYILNTSSLTIPRTQEVDMAMNKKTREYIQNKKIKLVRYSECK